MAVAAIRAYFQCEACEYGSFEIKEIEQHMQAGHTDQAAAVPVGSNVVEDVEEAINKTDVELVFGEEEEDDNDDVDEDIDDSAISVGAEPSSETGGLVAEGTANNCVANLKSSAALESNSDSDPSDVIWSNGAVRLLIGLVREDMDKFAAPSTPKHYLWKGISWKMGEKGYSYTHVRCDNKWRSLKKTYRNARQLVRAGKREAKKWKFYDVMDEFMAEQDLEVESNGATGTGDEVANRRAASSAVVAKKRRKLAAGATSSAATENDESSGDKVESNRERRHREKMEQMKRFNVLFELFVNNNKSIDGHQRSHVIEEAIGINS